MSLLRAKIAEFLALPDAQYYDMGRTNIKSDGFELQVYTQNVDLTRNYNLPNEVATQNVVTYNDYLA
jgi:hypothetical protein